MASLLRQPKTFLIVIFISVICSINLTSANKELDENNWKEILKGEWLVKFYAPWCPACTALESTWKELSSRAQKKSLQMKAAAVDVTKSPGLSGRFVVTALPTIFHVKDGEFRQYKGPRDVDSMLEFVEKQRWKQTEPIPGWKAPHSLQMTLVAEFFKLSQALRSVHNMLMETYGLPTWGSYLIFAVATIFVGALLGLILVCIIDLLYPPRRGDKVFVSKDELDQKAKGDHDKEKSDVPEIINDDIVDEAENENDSDAERNSPPDTSEDEQDSSGKGDKPQDSAAEASGDVRKRRVRKDD